jgi:hypothetical protein
MSDRPGYRSRPLLDINGVDVTVETIPPDDIQVYSAPHYMVFIERMWHGDYQQVPVDPDSIPRLIEALEAAMEHANADDVVALDTEAAS